MPDTVSRFNTSCQFSYAGRAVSAVFDGTAAPFAFQIIVASFRISAYFLLFISFSKSFTNPVEKASEIDVNRIFERFYNGHMSTRKTTGLGLSIVNVLTEQMGGSASAPLQGNELTIQVELPRY